MRFDDRLELGVERDLDLATVLGQPTLAALNIPSRREVSELTRKVDELSKKIDTLRKRRG